jgi:hypothetical protein
VKKTSIQSSFKLYPRKWPISTAVVFEHLCRKVNQNEGDEHEPPIDQRNIQNIACRQGHQVLEKKLSRIPTTPRVMLIKRDKEVIQVVNKAGKKQAQNKRES